MDPFGGPPSGGGWPSHPPGAYPPQHPADPFAAGPFGSPGPGGPYAPPPRPEPQHEETNTLATLSVVFSFVLAPVGAVLGHLALGQIKQRHQRGRDRALVGITLSYTIIVVLVVGLVVWVALPTAKQTPSDTAQGFTATTSPTTSSSVTTSASPTPPSSPTSPSAPPPPVTGNTIAGLLLDGEELGKILGEPFESAPAQPATVGGLDQMPNGLATEAQASPHDCVAATTIAQRSTYQSANVTAYAGEDWQTDGGDAVIAVDEAVVALPAAADAQALFSTLSEQWRRCEGQTVTVLAGPAPDGSNFIDKVTNVRVVDSVVAATIQSDHTSGGWARPEARAIGVRGNTLVEVDVSFHGGDLSAAPAKPDTAGIDVARALMAKLG
jgi:hypothetical protein